eukprot:m.102211 g.102211  ORF g.102211 m.102211 type:complete len:294 (+) comp13764_c0_seq2:210-1091(+)
MGADDLEDDFDLELDTTVADDEPSPTPVDKKKEKKNKRHRDEVFDGISGEWVAREKMPKKKKMTSDDKKTLRKVKRKKRSEYFAKKQDNLVSGAQGSQEDIANAFSEGLSSGCKVKDLIEQFADIKPSPNDFLQIPKQLQELGQELWVKCIKDWATTMKIPLTTPPKKCGSPRVLVICGSASRAVELCKILSEIQAGKIGKLFGKHKALSSQQEFLKNTPICISVGTPARVLKLLDSKHLNLKNVALIVYDFRWKNALGRTLFEQPDSIDDIISLYVQHFAACCKNNGKLGLI